MGSGLEREVEGAEMGFEMATVSLLECINAAMEAEGFAPASMGGRTKAMATSEDMLEDVRGGREHGRSRGKGEMGKEETNRKSFWNNRTRDGSERRRMKAKSRACGAFRLTFTFRQVWRKLTRLVSAFQSCWTQRKIHLESLGGLGPCVKIANGE
jgi:hypothetical protein